MLSDGKFGANCRGFDGEWQIPGCDTYVSFQIGHQNTPKVDLDISVVYFRGKSPSNHFKEVFYFERLSIELYVYSDNLNTATIDAFQFSGICATVCN